MASVKLVDVNKSFDGNNMVVNGVNFSIGDGDFLVIVGPSGCGKSTTLNLIAGLDEVTSGQIYINDQLVNGVEPKDRNVSMVFQSHTLGVQGGKVHTRYFIFFLLSIFFIPEIFAQDKILDRPEWKEFFDKHEATGTILIVDSRASAEKVSVYDRTRAGKRYSPASTFKVPHTLFALDAGVVKDEFQVFPWDGVKRGYAPHNQDQNLRSAMRHSALWVYEKFAKAIGEEKARSYLSRISYGNMDPSTKGGAYWVDGKLAISAEEQVVFLKKLYQNDLPFELEHQRLLKDVMIVEAEKDWILRAKTGWEGRHGWWVGWVEWSAGPVFFALNIDTPNRWEDLYKREAIARDILISIRALPPNKSMQPTAKASAD